MNIKDAYVHVGPSGTNEKALLKDFAITAAQITLTRAIQNDAGTGDKTETLDIPIWNQSTTGNAATASALSVIKSTAATVHYLTFVDSNNDSAANENFYTSTNLTVNPSTGALTTNGDISLYAASGDSPRLIWQRSSLNQTELYDWSAIDSGGNLYFAISKGNGWENLFQFGSNGNFYVGSTAVSLNGHTHDGRYYTETESDARFVLKAGDTMTGALTVPSLSVTGAATFSQAIDGSILGNAATASRLQNARTISLTGSITGSGSFDGSGNLSIATTTNHSHSQYLPLAGGIMTGTITRNYDSASDSPTISVQSDNQNIWIWRVKDKNTGSATSTSQVYGFGLKYLGAQAGDNNSLGLYADNQGGAQVLAMEIKQSGNTIFSQNVTAAKFIKSDGTSSQFLKADGSVDSNSYLISSTNVTTATWTAKTDNVNYPIAFSPNATPVTSGNAYNTGFTFNPGTKTFNNNGCRQQYDSTNKVLKFIFD